MTESTIRIELEGVVHTPEAMSQIGEARHAEVDTRLAAIEAQLVGISAALGRLMRALLKPEVQ